MFVPSIFLEDVGETSTFRMPEPENRAIGIKESIEHRRSVRLKEQFSLHFGLLLLLASLALLYFAIY